MIYANITHSKELKDLFPDAEWWWVNGKLIEFSNIDKSLKREWDLPALTTDMLLEILCWNISHENNFYQLLIQKNPDSFSVYYGCYTNGADSIFMLKIGKQIDKSLPNALSLMVKYLRDSGLLKEVNYEKYD